MISILTKKKIAIGISMRILISDVILQTHAAYTVSSMDRINNGGIFNRNCMQLNKVKTAICITWTHKERDPGMYRDQDRQMD